MESRTEYSQLDTRNVKIGRTSKTLALAIALVIPRGRSKSPGNIVYAVCMRPVDSVSRGRINHENDGDYGKGVVDVLGENARVNYATMIRRRYERRYTVAAMRKIDSRGKSCGSRLNNGGYETVGAENPRENRMDKRPRNGSSYKIFSDRKTLARLFAVAGRDSRAFRISGLARETRPCWIRLSHPNTNSTASLAVLVTVENEPFEKEDTRRASRTHARTHERHASGEPCEFFNVAQNGHPQDGVEYFAARFGARRGSRGDCDCRTVRQTPRASRTYRPGITVTSPFSSRTTVY